MNAISLEMLDEVIAAAYALRDTELRCVVLAGDGRAFCSGIDIMSLSSLLGQDIEQILLPRTHGDANKFQEFALAWADLEVPVIAALHGVCFGAGLQLAAAADIRVAAPDTKLSIMEMKWGLVPDMGGMALLPRLMRGDHLRRLIYSAEVVEALEAERLGLVSEICDDPLARAMELAEKITEQSPSAIKAAKRLITAAEHAERAEVLRIEAAEQAALIGKPDQMAAIAKGMRG